jgi:hypothetical protein
MRNFLLLTTVIAAGLTVAGIEVKAQSYSSPGAGMRYNGPPYGSSDFKPPGSKKKKLKSSKRRSTTSSGPGH